MTLDILGNVNILYCFDDVFFLGRFYLDVGFDVKGEFVFY